MYELVQPFPRHTKAPLFALASAASGTLATNGAGTYTLTDAAGNLIASGSVDSSSSPNALTVEEWKTLDGTALALTPGCYLMELLLNLVDSAGQQRVRSYDIVLSVPGSRVYSHYPATMDLQAFLVGAGMLDNPPSAAAMLIDLDAACATAVASWERMTGWHPFLADAAPSTRTFDPPGPVQSGAGVGSLWTYAGGGWELDLRGGALSVSAVNLGTTSYLIGPPAGQVYALPVDAAVHERPYDALRFVWPVYGTPQSLTITAQWGYAAALPEDVWSLLLRMAAMEVLPQLALLRTGGMVEVKQEGLLRRYAGTNQFGPFDGQADAWQKTLRQKAFYYKRRKIA